jgi:hypothetical protein
MIYCLIKFGPVNDKDKERRVALATACPCSEGTEGVFEVLNCFSEM